MAAYRNGLHLVFDWSVRINIKKKRECKERETKNVSLLLATDQLMPDGDF